MSQRQAKRYRRLIRRESRRQAARIVGISLDKTLSEPLRRRARTALYILFRGRTLASVLQIVLSAVAAALVGVVLAYRALCKE